MTTHEKYLSRLFFLMGGITGPQKMDSTVDRIRNKQGISPEKNVVEKMHKNALGTGIAIYQAFYYLCKYVAMSRLLG